MNRTARVGTLLLSLLLVATHGETAFHTVRPGDTLSKIGRTTGHTVDDLRAMNPDIKKPDLLKVGSSVFYLSEEDRHLAMAWFEENPSTRNDQRRRAIKSKHITYRIRPNGDGWIYYYDVIQAAMEKRSRDARKGGSIIAG